MKRHRSFLGALATVVLLSFTALAQAPAQFSADMTVHTTRGDDMKGKLFFGGKKMRTDMDMRGRSMSTITDLESKKAYTLMHEQQMYMEHDLSRPLGRGPRMPEIKQYDASNPCANQEGTTCKKNGTETVNGRTCDVWEFTRNGAKDQTSWIDQKLHIPVKTVHADGTTFELTNIKEAAQPASQFEIPSGFQKMDMGAFGAGRRPTDQ